MTLNEARKMGIPELDIEGCDGCQRDLPFVPAILRLDSKVKRIHEETDINRNSTFLSCTAPSDETLFMAVWNSRERLRDAANKWVHHLSSMDPLEYL